MNHACSSLLERVTFVQVSRDAYRPWAQTSQTALLAQPQVESTHVEAGLTQLPLMVLPSAALECAEPFSEVRTLAVPAGTSLLTTT
eukprot:4060982-Amphidinium_carterae.1